MKSAIKIFLLTLWAFFVAWPLSAKSDKVVGADSLEVGLLTCSPGKDVYELYGHTALRIRHLNDKRYDWVFNYGMFDFGTPNFIWRFTLGETDYFLGAQPYSRFAASYRRSGRSIEEQVLNLTPAEKARLQTSLENILFTPGWTYRYKFIYDNCTTRAVDEVENCLSGTIRWAPTQDTAKTYRDIIHEFAAQVRPWNNFGQDLILGAELDRKAGQRGLLFSPIYAARAFDHAVVVDSVGQERPLVLKRRTLVEVPLQAPTLFPVSPMAATLLLTVLTLGVCVMEWRKHRVCHICDDVLMFFQGLAGCIVFFLFFFSVHPAVSSNWLILLLNPLPLLYLPVKIRRNIKNKADHYHTALLVALALFAAACAFNRLVATPTQVFPDEIYVLALLLLVRCISVRRLQQKYHII